MIGATELADSDVTLVGRRDKPWSRRQSKMPWLNLGARAFQAELSPIRSYRLALAGEQVDGAPR